MQSPLKWFFNFTHTYKIRCSGCSINAIEAFRPTCNHLHFSTSFLTFQFIFAVSFISSCRADLTNFAWDYHCTAHFGFSFLLIANDIQLNRDTKTATVFETCCTLSIIIIPTERSAKKRQKEEGRSIAQETCKLSCSCRSPFSDKMCQQWMCVFVVNGYLDLCIQIVGKSECRVAGRSSH